jgi:ribonuclease BN (tRNA processing enzyme)
MRVLLLPSAVAGCDPAFQFLSTTLINDTVAIDAGCLGLYGTVEQQARVKHVFLTHSHMDHLASLPIFLNNVYTGGPDCVTVYGGEAVLDCLRRDIFNDRVWPDFVRISEQGRPFLKLHPLAPGQPTHVAGLSLTPIPVNHVVPTTGYLVEEGDRAVLFAADTGPTEEIWAVANRTPSLRAVFLEATYPNAQEWLADLSRHLTAAQFGAEVRKVRRSVPFLAVHLFPKSRDQVVRELGDLGMPNVEVARFGVPYDF